MHTQEQLSFTHNLLKNGLISEPCLTLSTPMAFIIALAGIHHTHTYTTSLNSKQPSQPFKCTSLRRDAAACLVQSSFSIGCLTCPLQHDAITSILQLVFACTCFITNVRICDANEQRDDKNHCYCDIGPVSPQIWRSVCRLWFHIGFIWSCSGFL